MKTLEEIKNGLKTCAHDLNCNQCTYKGFKCLGLLMQDAVEALQQLEAKAPKWISVEERLPEAKLAVLAFGQRYSSYNKKGEPFPMTHVAYTRGEGEGWFTYSNDDYVEVTHWMPLPEPPVEE
ncbi:MAG: DUF551 domain-containing protein [Bacteroidaceae bacterium]|nr:DUF551 domain-containing protein [Bacteroidaceae bacterium]